MMVNFLLPRPLCNDVSEATQILTNNVISLLVEVAAGRIHHISRGQSIVHPLALFTRVSETARVKPLHRGASPAQSPKEYDRCQSLLKNQSYIFLGISPTQPQAPSARISTSSQALYLFSSVQMFAISGRE